MNVSFIWGPFVAHPLGMSTSFEAPHRNFKHHLNISFSAWATIPPQVGFK